MKTNEIHVPVEQTRLDTSRDTTEHTWSFPVSDISITIFVQAMHSVAEKSGDWPVHYIVGLKTYYEISVMVGVERLRDILRGELVVDTSREHYFAAVADPRWQAGRPLPSASVWTYDTGGWVPND